MTHGIDRVLPADTRTQRTYSTTVIHDPYTGWLPAFGVTGADAVQNLRNIVGNFNAKPYYQLAPVRPERPSAPTVFASGAYENAAGFVHYHETISNTTAFWIRFGSAHANSLGTDLGSGEVGLEFAAETTGRVYGTATFSVNPRMLTSGDTNYMIVTDFEAAIGLSAIMAAIVVTDNLADYLEYQLAIRTAIDRRAPNAWQTMEQAWTNPSTANSERNTSELSIPTGANIATNMWFQLALAFRKKSGALGNPRADFSVVTAGRYA